MAVHEGTCISDGACAPGSNLVCPIHLLCLPPFSALHSAALLYLTALYSVYIPTQVAAWFETLAKAERSHAGRFERALEELRSGALE
jgi:rubrerythrin